MGPCDHFDSQSLFRRIHAGFRFFLLLEQGRALSILDTPISRPANSLRESLITLAELD